MAPWQPVRCCWRRDLVWPSDTYDSTAQRPLAPVSVMCALLDDRAPSRARVPEPGCHRRPSAATGVVHTATAGSVAHGRARGHRQCNAVPPRSWVWQGRQHHEQRRPLPQLPLTATRLRRRSPGLDPSADTRRGWPDTAAAVTRVREQHDVASHTHVATTTVATMMSLCTALCAARTSRQS